MFFDFLNNRVVYSKFNTKETFEREQLELVFTDSNAEIPLAEIRVATVGATLAPILTDVGFKMVAAFLDRRQKKFSAEYVCHSSYLTASSRMIPNISFKRNVQMESKFKNALTVDLKSQLVDGIDAFYFYVSSIQLDLAKAKTASRSKIFDYAIEITSSFLSKDHKKEDMISLIPLHSIPFGMTNFDGPSHRSAILPIVKGSLFVGASVKVVETNPEKVRAEEMQQLVKDQESELIKLVKELLKPKKGSDKKKDS